MLQPWGFVGLGWDERGRARPTQKLWHQLSASIPSSTSIPIFLPFRRLGMG